MRMVHGQDCVENILLNECFASIRRRVDFGDGERERVGQKQCLKPLVEIDVIVGGAKELKRVKSIDEKIKERLPCFFVSSCFKGGREEARLVR